MKRPVIVFDMNETLLDMSSLDPTFGRIFGRPDGAELRKTWFTQVLELFLTATVVGEYRPFDELTDDALTMLAAKQGGEVSAADRAMLEEAQRKMPAHRDVPGGLDRLAAAGFTLAVLTNSTRQSAVSLLEQSGLAERFDHVFSADEVKRYKPAREAYAHVAREMDVEVGDVLLVAAHAWDITGALAAGCRAAFIERPGKVLSRGAPAPELIASDVADLAERIAERS